MYTVNKQIVSHLIPVSAFLLAVYSVLPYFKPGIPVVSTLNNTAFWWAIASMILIVFFLSKHFFYDRRNADNMQIVWVYLLWNAMCIVRGMFVAEIYWDWKALIGNTLALMMPIVVFSATNKMVVQSLLAFYIKYALPLFLIVGLLIRTDAFGFYLVPVSFILFFFPVLTSRQRIIILVATLLVLVADLGARSSVIKFGVPFLILLVYYLRNLIPPGLFGTLRLILIIIPFVFFGLAVSGVFNVFNMDDYLNGEFTSKSVDSEGNRVEQNVIVDTRTFLYVEVLESAINNNYWLLGRTPARGNDSDTFGVLEAELTGRNERLANEIGIANVFTWTGLVGVSIYFLLFFQSTFLAVNRSRNIYAKMLGLYVAFRWLYSWVEDVNNFSLNYFMLMMMIGLCFSNSFRNMTNKEFSIWARGIFDERYVRLQYYLFRKNRMEEESCAAKCKMQQQE